MSSPTVKKSNYDLRHSIGAVDLEKSIRTEANRRPWYEGVFFRRAKIQGTSTPTVAKCKYDLTYGFPCEPFQPVIKPTCFLLGAKISQGGITASLRSFWGKLRGESCRVRGFQVLVDSSLGGLGLVCRV